MRFFTKLFLWIVLILTISLSAAQYYTVSRTFDNSIKRQIDESLKNHQTVKYAVQSNIISSGEDTSLTPRDIENVARKTGSSLNVDIDIKEAEQAVDTRDIQYVIEKNDSGKSIVRVWSNFTTGDYTWVMTTRYDVSQVFGEVDDLQKTSRNIFVIVLVFGAVFSLVLAFGITRPIKKLNETSIRFADGDYDARLEPGTKDEIGELTANYNDMADSIKNKIYELELAVTQREDFNASFAHELKTPMTSIIGYADMLYQKDMPTEQVHEAAGYILNEGLRLEALSFKLMELITLNKNDFILEETDISELLDDVYKTSCKKAEDRGIVLTLENEACGVYVRVENDLFKTLMLNLVDNAVKSGGDKVTIQAEEVSDSDESRGKDRAYGTDRDHENDEVNEVSGKLRISVRDNGRGIPENELDRITEAFYMVDKSRSRKEHGAGLGLALCDKIAKLHGTELTFVSTMGLGTEVSFELEYTSYE